MSRVRAARVEEVELSRYGPERLVRPRLGQGAFRVLVTDSYDRRCALSAERTLPVLQAAHIKPYAVGGRHDVSNGLLFRSDIHMLRPTIISKSVGASVRNSRTVATTTRSTVRRSGCRPSRRFIPTPSYFAGTTTTSSVD